MIVTSNLSKSYNGTTVLNIEELSIPKGQSFGLVGNNGAGKTTYFSLLLDLIKPSSGSIKNNDVLVHKSEDWKPFTSSFIDESFDLMHVTEVCERIVVLEKGNVIKDLETNPATLKELETHFASGAMTLQEEE